MGNWRPTVRHFDRLRFEPDRSSRRNDDDAFYETHWFQAMVPHAASLEPAIGTTMLESPTEYPAFELVSSSVQQSRGKTYVVMTFRQTKTRTWEA